MRVLEAGSTRLARKMDTYITSNMAELPKMLERRDTSEPMNVRTTCPADRRALIRLVATATIRERRLFRSALAQVRLLFESGVYSRGASIRSYTVDTLCSLAGCSNKVIGMIIYVPVLKDFIISMSTFLLSTK